MDETVTVRDVMDRSYVGVNEADPVVGAARLMREEGVDSALVLRGSDPVGVLRADDIVSLVAAEEDPDDVTVGEVMSTGTVSVAADSPVEDAVDAIAENGLRRVIVRDGEDVAGVLSEHDVVTAHTVLSTPDTPREAPTATAPGLESEVYGSQGVCEVCGSLTRNLTEYNGQLVCADCRDM